MKLFNIFKSTLCLLALFITSNSFLMQAQNVFPLVGNAGIGTITPEQKLHIVGGTDANAATGGYIQLGSTNSVNMGIDNNEIQARNNMNPEILYLQHAGGNLALVNGGGNVGIGTSAPTQKLDVNGTIQGTQLKIDGGWISLQKPSTNGGWARGFFNMDGNTGLGGVGLLGSGSNPEYYYMAHGLYPWSSGLGLYIKTNGNVGVGTTEPTKKLDVNGTIQGTNLQINDGYIRIKKPTTTGGWARGFFNTDSNNGFIGGVGLLGSGSNSQYYYMAHGATPYNSGLGLYVMTNGDVGIGTTTPQNKLDVCGTIRGKEVLVESSWCDYVFDEDYNLPTIEEEKEHIKTAGYLLGFESEEEMRGEINVGDVTKRQQQKIEEQMLHIIELNDENKELKELVLGLVKDVEMLKAQIQK